MGRVSTTCACCRSARTVSLTAYRRGSCSPRLRTRHSGRTPGIESLRLENLLSSEQPPAVDHMTELSPDSGIAHGCTSRSRHQQHSTHRAMDRSDETGIAAESPPGT
jgi:hypothetical protein